MRKLPYHEEAEVAVLGSVLLQNDVLERIIDLLQPEDFYFPKHRAIFGAMVASAEATEPVDEVSLHNRLKITGQLEEAGGVAELAFLSNRVPTAANAEHYANIVKDKAVLRRLIDSGTQVIQECYQDVPDMGIFLDSVEQKILSVTEKRVRCSAYSMRECMRETVQQLSELYENKKDVTGTPTGFIDLDELTSGFQPGDLIIIAARPSMGKTSLAMNMLCHAAVREQVPVGFFSLEMPRQQLAFRLLCSEARLDLHRARKGDFKGNEWDRLIKAAGSLSEAPIFIDDTPGLTALELRARARRMKADHNVSMIGIDYLQLMAGRADISSREQQISDISRKLKGIGSELGMPILGLSQLNRGPDARTDKRPLMSDLRESGAIEQDADLIIFIYRDEV